MRTRRDESRGVALVSVLLIVVIVTVLAFEIANRHAFSLAMSRQTLDGSQARHYALGGELYARLLLQEDWLDENTRTKDTFEESWAMPEESFEIDEGSVEMRIVDLNSRFNLNAVTGSEAAPSMRHFNRLLTHLGLDPNVVDAWRDWIDADGDVTGAGAEDADYLLDEPPRVTANQPARDVSEFLVPVRLEPEEFALIRPLVTVLPTSALKINVNTANGAVLGTAAPNFPPAEAELFAGERRDFDRVEDVVALHAPLAASISALSVTSEYFRVQVRVNLRDSRVELTSLLHRDAASGEVTVLSRNFGTRFEPADDEEESV
ncbi:MAG: general secretion pathway protein GspK [Gammaproteobacteria bacterium]|nr:general secretion pathway protein GspK [Gammaproteobacteria bacterium]